MMRFSSFSKTVSVGVLLLIVQTSSATSIVKRTFGQLCGKADLVLVGTVAAVEARADGDTHTIHTYTRFEDLSWIHGGEGLDDDAYTLRTLGGVGQDEAMIVEGMPEFEVGQRYVLFIRGNNERMCPVIGWQQGCFRVVRDAAGSECVENFAGRRVVSVSPRVMIAEPGAESSRRRTAPMPLESFLDVVRDRIDSMRDEGVQQP